MAIKLTRLVANKNLFNVLSKPLTTLSMSPAWTTKKVVPDVIDSVPPNKLGVQYPEITVNEGNVVRPSQAKNPPAVSWAVQDQSFYALCMTDPDAPSRSKPKQREWLHWLVVNIPGNSVEKGETLAEYIGAGPPRSTDLHRHVFLLYAYPTKIDFSSEKRLSNTSADRRPNFYIRKFAQKYNLGEPIAGNFFVAEFDDYVPQLFKQLGLS